MRNEDVSHNGLNKGSPVVSKAQAECIMPPEQDQRTTVQVIFIRTGITNTGNSTSYTIKMLTKEYRSCIYTSSVYVYTRQ